VRTVEKAKMATAVSTETTRQFDPAAEVPDEYDVFCEACGYSLAGLTNDRCPECGVAFEPKDLPFARIPWLHRKRLGKPNAYVRTVMMVCFMPGRFARELCRPVRISAADARKFRMTTISLLTLLVAVAAVWLIVWRIATAYRSILIVPAGTRHIITDAGLSVLAIAAWVAAFHLFLRLATDMPLFIWKGLSRTDLAPIHYYACAPLAFLPIAGGALGYWFFVLLETHFRLENAFIWVCTGTSFFWLAWLWATALQLMAASADVGRKRLLLLAAYLPAHWLVTLAISILLFFLAVMMLHLLAHRLLN